MENYIELFQNRRSVRTYTGEPIPEEQLKSILQVALISESGRNRRPWEFVVVKDREHLKRLTNCKVGSGKMLEKAGAAIVVAVDPEKTDMWTCDGAIVLANMHLYADAIGLGSCYVNALNRRAVTGGDVETFLKNDLKIPEKYRIVGMLSLGIPAGEKPSPYTLDNLEWTKVHEDMF